MYEQITVEIDRSYGEGTYRSHSVNFTGRLVQLIEEGLTTMRLYELGRPGLRGLLGPRRGG